MHDSIYPPCLIYRILIELIHTLILFLFCIVPDVVVLHVVVFQNNLIKVYFIVFCFLILNACVSLHVYPACLSNTEHNIKIFRIALFLHVVDMYSRRPI